MALESEPEPTESTSLLPIGAVTRMTGLTSHTLRKWESRYGLVTPTRTDSDRRLYSEAEVRRLLLIRELIDQGMQPSHLQGLDDAALMAMRSRSLSVELPRPQQSKGPITVVGAILGAALQLAARDATADIRLSSDSLEGWLDRTETHKGVVLLEANSLQRSVARRLIDRARASGAHLVVVYGYANRSTLTLLEEAGINCVKAPATAHQILAVAMGDRPAARPAQEDSAPPLVVPPRRYTDQQIARLAVISTAIDCECPAHVAQLLSSIIAFEQYSTECSDTDPAQRELHRYLERLAGAARGMFESAAARIAETEGFEI